ncbi:MAG: CCA tRNA nucleotidyltransferase [Planctomycetales bacterium]|nr:CCA tRNA nucleotidyltransferase [Planctomycetales bacterium]
MPELDPADQRAFALEVAETLRAAGYEALWAGGCVRDQLLGRTPKDYDVATNAQPQTIRQVFGRERTIAVGAAFGVIAVVGPKTAGLVEVTTFREDAQYSDGRRPDSVTFSTAEHDAQRRDFTINGLFYDPLAQRVIDYVGGQEDLRGQTVRAIGDARRRFSEDKLRLLRAVRFAATFQFSIEAETLAAVGEMAAELPVVSPERIAAEMRRMLVDGHRVRAVELLAETGLMPVIAPEIAAIYANGWEKSAWEETLAAAGRLACPDFPLALAALCHRLAPADIHTLARRWKLSNHERELAAWLVEQLPTVRRAAELPWPVLQRLLIAVHIEPLLELLEAVEGEAHAGLRLCRERLAWPIAKLNPPPLVTGDDLIAHGLPPGKNFRTILDQVRDAQLEGKLTTQAEALALAKQLAN